jgi:hypothetical protein
LVTPRRNSVPEWPPPSTGSNEKEVNGSVLEYHFLQRNPSLPFSQSLHSQLIVIFKKNPVNHDSKEFLNSGNMSCSNKTTKWVCTTATAVQVSMH